MSPLEETSRDPEQNAGFVVTWVNSNQESRVSSYCVQNTFQEARALTISGKFPLMSLPLQVQRWSSSRKFPESLSRLLASTKMETRSFAAFKALPVDPARNMRGTNASSGRYSETSEEVADALNCREVVDRIVDAISRVCEREFSVNEDVVRCV